MKLLPGSLVCIIFSIKSVNDRKYVGINYIIGRIYNWLKERLITVKHIMSFNKAACA